MHSGANKGLNYGVACHCGLGTWYDIIANSDYRWEKEIFRGAPSLVEFFICILVSLLKKL